MLCPRCGATVTFPRPREDELERAYGEWYRPGGGRFSGPGDRLIAWGRKLAARAVAASAPPGPILDVGSGDGTMLAAFERAGRVAVGIERADEQVIPKPPEPAAGWAAIVFWHSLEHLPQPGEAIDRAAAALAPEGVLVISTPNRASLQAAVFGDRWLHLDLPRHLSHPTPAVVKAHLERAGLEPVRTSRWRGGQNIFGWLHGLVGALPGTADLYSAIRRPVAREGAAEMGGARRLATLVAGALLLPAAVIMALIEALLGRPGTIYVEARRG